MDGVLDMAMMEVSKEDNRAIELSQMCFAAYEMEHQCLSVSLPFPSRVGQRGSSGLSMSAARSEHEVSEIIDGLSEQEVRPGCPFSSSSLLTPLFSEEDKSSLPGPVVKSDTNPTKLRPR